MPQHKMCAAEKLSPSPVSSLPGESKGDKSNIDTNGDDSNYEADGTRRYELRYPHLITRHWCTPQCLLGLKCGLPMDPDCPNVGLHCTLADCHDHSKHNHPHTLDHVKAAMRAKQRRGHVWQTMEPILRCRGDIGQLFRFLHPDLGYAFAAKGMVSDCAQLLEREIEIYDHIWKTVVDDQKKDVPLIGSIKVNDPKDSDHGKQVSVRVAVSFGGIEPAKDNFDATYPLDEAPCNMWLLLSYHSYDLINKAARQELQKQLCLPEDTEQAWKAIRDECGAMLLRLGVQEDDVHLGNMLWCQRLMSLVLIDFEESQLVSGPKASSQ